MIIIHIKNTQSERRIYVKMKKAKRMGVRHHKKEKKVKVKRITDRFYVKVMITLCVLIFVQLGNIFPIPTINTTYFSYLISKTNVLGMMNRFSGGAFGKMTIFALGISVYISASIIVQMLTAVFRKMEELERNGAYGKKQLEKITVLFSIVLSVSVAFSFSFALRQYGLLRSTSLPVFFATAVFLCLGSLILIFLGKMIDKWGIGNGITIILMMNMISYLPSDGVNLYYGFIKGHSIRWVTVIGILLCLLGMAILLNEIEKRIHLQYSTAPIENETVNEIAYLAISGRLISVMPAILASTIFQVISFIVMFSQQESAKWFRYFDMSNWFDKEHPMYTLGFIGYLLLMIFFSYFYVSITLNENQTAHNFRKEGITVDNIRPGEETAIYLKKALRQIIWICLFLLFVIITVPMVVTGFFHVTSLNTGGTTIVIIVGTMLETIRSVKGEWMVHNYEKKKWL